MAKDSKKLEQLKTGAFERKASLAAAGIKGGGSLLANKFSSMFLSDEEKQQKRSEVLSREALKFADTLSELKGSMVKMGQMMALYGQHFLPAELVIALRSLESDSTALSWSVVEKQIIEQLGAERFAQLDIEQEPIGAASLSQVHKAVIIETGEVICLKILYPGIKKSIDSDMKDLTRIMKYSGLIKVNDQFEEWLLELKSLLQQEVDYEFEKAAMLRFSKRLENTNIFAVPKIYPEFCSQDIIAASFENGLTPLQVSSIDLATRNVWAEALLELFMKEVFLWGELQTDPNFGNYRFRPADDSHPPKLVLLDFGATRRCEPEFIEGLKLCIKGAWQEDYEKVKQGAIALKILPETKSEKVFYAFFELCKGLLEPGRCKVEKNKLYVDEQQRYLWRESILPKRMAKQLTYSDCAKDLAVPPKEFLFVSRKLLGVFNLIAALDARFSAEEIFNRYLLD